MRLTSPACFLRATRHSVQATRCSERGSPATLSISAQPNLLLTIPTSHSLYHFPFQSQLNSPLLFRSFGGRATQYPTGAYGHVRTLEPPRFTARGQTAQAADNSSRRRVTWSQ